LLVGGDGAPTANGSMASFPNYLEQEKIKQVYLNATSENWKKLTDKFNSVGISVTTKDSKKYSIKFLLGTDAVHGDQHTVGKILFPHNIGLSCTHNPSNFENVGYWTK
jgi:beta-glucosidase